MQSAGDPDLLLLRDLGIAYHRFLGHAIDGSTVGNNKPTAIPWERLPFEVAGCSGMTCWRRLRARQGAGLWNRIHHHMLERLNPQPCR
ncbi:transposase [Sinorhizobium meliloti]|nr:transposase [Sinorhizobium meliloti]